MRYIKLFYEGKRSGGKEHILKHQKNKYIVMFSLHILSKEDGENYGEFSTYEFIKHRLYVGNIENTYDNLTENDKLIKLWRNYQAELVANKNCT